MSRNLNPRSQPCQSLCPRLPPSLQPPQIIALYELQRIQKKLESDVTDTIEANRPHHAQMLFVIKQELEDKKA